MPPALIDQSALLAWGERARRDLPWRRTRDPWAVLVSEFMLQQTQVSRVQPRYDAFLRRFPTAGHCRAAPVGEVVALWSGLGYNRRAVHLHACAGQLAERHGGRVPPDLDALLALPGVGPYTARAVLAFAFERDVGVVDTNVARLLARHLGRPLGAKEVQATATAAVPPGRGWAWNQAMLDLGATVCVSGEPRCGRCPVRAGCSWHRDGLPEPDPALGSAGVSGPQPPFEGSDRQGRGRLVRALCEGPVPVDAVPVTAGWPDDPPRARRAADSLVADGLAAYEGDRLTLPRRPRPSG